MQDNTTPITNVIYPAPLVQKYLSVRKDDYRADFEYPSQMATEHVSIGPYTNTHIFKGGSMVDSEQVGEDITKNVMGNMETLFDVFNQNGMQATDRVKIDISRAPNNALKMKITGYPSEDPRQEFEVALNNSAAATQQSDITQYSIASVNEKIHTLQAELLSLRSQAAQKSISGSTVPGSTQWRVASRHTLYDLLEVTIDLSQYYMVSPPRTVIAQLYELRKGVFSPSKRLCTTGDVTTMGFKVWVKLGRGKGLRHAENRGWHVHYACCH